MVGFGLYFEPQKIEDSLTSRWRGEGGLFIQRAGGGRRKTACSGAPSGRWYLLLI